jgi:hypothetical protein
VNKRRRFVLHPGWVVSRNDGQRHYIDGRALRRLYQVPEGECVVTAGKWPGIGERPGDVHLYPDVRGVYRPVEAE